MSTPDLPAAVRRYLETILLSGRQPAYAFVTPDGTLERWGGDLERYVSTRLRKGIPAVDAFDCVQGLLPLDDAYFSIPRLMIGEDRTVDLHLLGDAGGTWIIFLDATAEAQRESVLQQQSNDLQILKTRQLSMLAALRVRNTHLEEILHQLQVAAMRIAPDGTVMFINAFGRRLLGLGDDDCSARPHWRNLLPLGMQESEHFGRLLASATPDGGGVRTALTLDKGGVVRRLEIDVRLDPQDRTVRIAYLYDVSEVQELRSRLDEKAVFENMIGKSEPMQRIFQLIQDVARVNATVLIEGETGTGKELVARAIHFSSPRRDGPFVVVNCAGFTDSLINSQLFGHKKGAFTDAVSNQIGVFEAANGGTILLDEIGDIPMNTQTRILRALEQREIIRVGETEARKVDIRILAATNKNLEAEVRQERFRLDLLYRIRVARVMLPALRERRDDIPLLARAFVSAVAAENGTGTPDIAPETFARLLVYHWPGNVRELRNAIEFACIRCRDGRLLPRDLPPEVSTDSLPEADPSDSRKEQVLEALRAAGGNRGDAARRLHISRATLYRRMKQYGIDDVAAPAPPEAS